MDSEGGVSHVNGWIVVDVAKIWSFGLRCVGRYYYYYYYFYYG
jgi:hypothetical protein